MVEATTHGASMRLGPAVFAHDALTASEFWFGSGCRYRVARINAEIGLAPRLQSDPTVRGSCPS